MLAGKDGTLMSCGCFVHVEVCCAVKMSGQPDLKIGFAKDKWRKAKGSSDGASKSDEDIIRAVLAKFHVPKKVTVQSPYVPPPEQELFEHSGRSVRQLHQVSGLCRWCPHKTTQFQLVGLHSIQFCCYLKLSLFRKQCDYLAFTIPTCEVFFSL